jgi:short subunit dehydrogenase-like uncharacterized protein
LAAQYIAKTYGVKSFKWAIAGRRLSVLEQIRTELSKIDSSLSNLPIIIADSSDVPSLFNMIKQTKVIISTAGPFSVYGSDLVRACAYCGTHYCDITGESDWVRDMIDKYDDVARSTGARIVNLAGHDCIPWDLVTLGMLYYYM